MLRVMCPALQRFFMIHVDFSFSRWLAISLCLLLSHFSWLCLSLLFSLFSLNFDVFFDEIRGNWMPLKSYGIDKVIYFLWKKIVLKGFPFSTHKSENNKTKWCTCLFWHFKKQRKKKKTERIDSNHSASEKRRTRRWTRHCFINLNLVEQGNHTDVV